MTKDVVCPDPSPHDVRLLTELLAVREGCSSVSGPAQLPDARVTLDAFDAQRRAERANAKIGDELLDDVPKGTLLLRCQAPPVAARMTRVRHTSVSDEPDRS